jgi:integrase
LLSSVRAECHLRWNQVKRLREITNKVIKKVQNEKLLLPFPFNYEESGHLNERLYFTLNKNSDNEYYLEFMKSISLLDGSQGERLFINVEPLYIACMFAIFAMDIQSYSGARINEILQVCYDPDCCIITEDKKGTSAKRNYIFRLIPKGRDTEENYYMPEGVFKSLLMIVKELKTHYNSDTLPHVDYSISSRKHLINNERKFVFQYNKQHINQFTLNSVIRFLTHCLIIQTEEGRQVILTTHLLRHAFATHAAQTEKLPIDIVRQLLHQRDESVTSYYAAPTHVQISGTIESLHDNWMSYIDIQQGIQRSPEELKNEATISRTGKANDTE